MKRTLFIIAAASLLMVSCSKKNCCTCSCGCGACQCCTDTTAKAGVPDEALIPYGKYKAKIDRNVLPQGGSNGKLIKTAIRRGYRIEDC